MSRFALWMINLTGVFLIMNRDPSEQSNTRMYLGGALIAIGTTGILVKLILMMRKPKASVEAAAEEEQ